MVSKRSVSLDDEVAAAVEEAAKQDGVSFSAWLSSAAEMQLRVRQGLRGVAAWEGETGSLSAEEVAAVAHAIQVVRDAGVTILVIAHHVGFVRQVADRCTVFDFGKVIASGTPAEVLEDRHVVEIFVGDGAKA